MHSSYDPTTALLALQIAWALLAAGWNLAGVMLIASGGRAPGPTASLVAAAVLVAIAIALLVARRWPLAYAGLSLLAAVMGTAAVHNAVTADPAL